MNHNSEEQAGAVVWNGVELASCSLPHERTFAAVQHVLAGSMESRLVAAERSLRHAQDETRRAVLRTQEAALQEQAARYVLVSHLAASRFESGK